MRLFALYNLLLGTDLLPDDKTQALSKLKAFADDKCCNFFSVVGLKTAGYQHFLLFLQCFHYASLGGGGGGVKNRHCAVNRFI